MGVGIPGTGMLGLPIAIALGAIIGKCVSSSEGIVYDDVDKSIHNLTSIGADAMCMTDDMILNIMTSKDNN